MIMTFWRTFASDTAGKAPVKLVLGSCLIALVVAMSSPVFETNPMISDTIGQFRHDFPKTLDTIRHAMGK